MAATNEKVGLATALQDRKMLVLYGSETGRGEEIALEVGDMAGHLHFSTMVEEMNDIQVPHLLQYSAVVFVISTTGQGDTPRNAVQFWKRLCRKSLPAGCLSQVSFTIFGLGDSMYQKFNWAARKLNKRLVNLGAKPFFPPGEGNESHNEGIDTVYLPWYQDLRSHLLSHYPLPEGVEPIPEETILEPRYSIAIRPDSAMGVIPGPGGIEYLTLEQQKQWQEAKELSAARSHVEWPKTRREQKDDDWERRNAVSSRGLDLARFSENSGHHLLKGGRVDCLDKDNILKDHPAKYLLQAPQREKSEHMQSALLPVPGGIMATVMENDRVTPATHWQDVRRITLSYSLPEEEWTEIPPGGYVTIYPKNFAADVNKLIQLMGWEEVADKMMFWKDLTRPNVGPGPLDKEVLIKPKKCYVGPGWTLRDLLVHNIDITAIPTRRFLDQISHFAKDEMQKERLRELQHKENSQEFYDYAARPRRTILEVLDDFDSVKIPYQRLPSIFPLIRGRDFSIATGDCPLKMPNDPDAQSIELLAALVEYKTIIRKPRQGLCSRYLKHLEPGTNITITLHVRNPLPHDKHAAQRPCIAIATGTGIAPIRRLLYDRMSRGRIPTLLFFGCRNREIDYYFEDEWKELDTRAFLDVHPSFSRPDAETLPMAKHNPSSWNPFEESNPRAGGSKSGTLPEPLQPKVVYSRVDHSMGRNYVQDSIREHHAEVCRYLLGKAFIVICGSAGKMPAAVRVALQDAMIRGGLCSDEKDAARKFNTLEVYEECW